MDKVLLDILKTFDITELFKGKKGGRLRWSSKRSIGGALATICVMDIQKHGINEYNLILASISVLPICLSFFEKE
tara:strand:- start:8 stop:232 length:225 start_codon:yes stop_codon:yes gene_type:complete